MGAGADWIGVFTASGTFTKWFYDSTCTTTAGSPKASGSCSVTMPTVAGDYVFRLYANNSTTLLATSNTVTVATVAAGSLYLSPSGSDSSPCSQAAPCRTFDRAYHLARPGSAVLLGSGDYGGQSLTYNAALVNASSPVVFQPAPGASPQLSGELSLRAAAGQPIANVEVDNLPIGDIYVRYVRQVTFRNIIQSYFFVRSSDRVSFIGGQVTGDSVGISTTIGATAAGAAPSTNILIDGVAFHDFNTTQAPGAHIECLFLQESDTVNIVNSTFNRCEDFDIYGNAIVGGTIKNVLLKNNHFGATTPKGYYAFRANVGAYTFQGNWWDQGMANDAPVSATGCGNILNFSNLPMPAALLKPC